MVLRAHVGFQEEGPFVDVADKPQAWNLSREHAGQYD